MDWIRRTIQSITMPMKRRWITAAFAVAVALAFPMIASGGTDHPVGVNYVQLASARPAMYNPPSSLPPELVLPGGFVDCVTCHTDRGLDTGELVISNEGSAMCMACHKK